MKNKVQEGLQTRIIKASAILIQNKLIPVQKPEPTAIFLKHVKRGPIGVVQRALRECLPSWALLGIDFIGYLIIEIIAEKKL